MAFIRKQLRSILPGFVVLLASAPAWASADDRATSAPASQELLTEAFRLTAHGERDKADAVYQKLLQCCPAEGYPAYARFLYRTGQTTAVQNLLKNDTGLAAQPALTRARAHVSAGERQSAIELLRQGDGAAGNLYTRTVLLANQLVMLGEKEQALAEIEKALVAPEMKDADRRDLFVQMINHGGSESLARALPTVVDALVTSSSLDYPALRALALGGLTALSMQPGYADFHASLEQAAGQSPARAWLAALSSLQRGNQDFALSVLEGISTTSLGKNQRRVLLEEKARLLAGDTDRTIPIYRELMEISGNTDRQRLSLATQYFRAHKIPETVEILRPLKFEALDDGDRMTALNLYLTSLGSTGPMKDLVTEYLRLSKGFPYAKVRDVASAPFPLFSPDNLPDLRAAVDNALQTSGSENLYVMLMSLENLMGNQAAITQALEKYVAVHPDNVDATFELADIRAAEAWKLVEDNPQTSAPLDQLNAAADRASHALWNAVRVKPYAPEPYNKLIALYNLYNQPEKAREVPRHLADRPNATAEEVHLAAYIYATQGYPELSIPLYERALKMQPDDTRYRLNYAAALGRVDRYDDAMTIYRDIMLNGVNGKQYHLHEVHGTALSLAVRSGRQAEHLQFLDELRGNPNVADRKQFLLGESKVLATEGFYGQALQFLETYRNEYPEDNIMVTDAMVGVYAEKGDFAAARAVLGKEIAQTTAPQDVAFLRNNLALTYRLEGNLDAAVAEWQRLADELPNEHTATHGLINAARALAQGGRVEQSRQLYNSYIKRNTGDVTGEQIARDELAKLDKMEVPTDMLVKSALLEYSVGDHEPGHAPTTDTGHDGHNH